MRVSASLNANRQEDYCIQLSSIQYLLFVIKTGLTHVSIKFNHDDLVYTDASFQGFVVLKKSPLKFAKKRAPCFNQGSH